MILNNMTPKEKIAQAEKLFGIIDRISDKWVEDNLHSLKKRKLYPFTQHIKRNFAEFGEWNLSMQFKSRPNIRRGIEYSIHSWQRYFVNRSDKVENIGAGLYFVGETTKGGVGFNEFTPHFFNRFKERYFQRQNKQDDFNTVVEELMKGMEHALICNSPKILEKKLPHSKKTKVVNIPHYEGYDNFAAFIPQGLCLGIQRRNEYYCFLTFIGEEELFDNQREIMTEAEKIMEERRRWKETTPEQRKKNMTKLLQYFQSLKETGNSNNSATLPLPLISF